MMFFALAITLPTRAYSLDRTGGTKAAVAEGDQKEEKAEKATEEGEGKGS